MLLTSGGLQMLLSGLTDAPATTWSGASWLLPPDLLLVDWGVGHFVNVDTTEVS
jgi:hypothetical protein